MKPKGGYKRRPARPTPQSDEERSAALFRYAVQLFDKGDGRAVDWPMVSAMLIKAGFAAWDEAGRSERAMQVLRRIEVHLYDRQAGNNPDDGTDFTSRPKPKPPASPGPAPSLDHDLHR